MKAILKFDLDDVDDCDAHMRCLKSLDMWRALISIQERIRKDWKYGEHSEETFNVINAMYADICEIIHTFEDLAK
jgi:hypothetical protein